MNTTQKITALVVVVGVVLSTVVTAETDEENKNASRIAKIAEDSGIQALSMHGRTRACLYKGDAEYDTIANVKQMISIPVIANGDINDDLYR